MMILCCYIFQRWAIINADHEVDGDIWKGDKKAVSHLKQGRVPPFLGVTTATTTQAWQQQQQQDLHDGTLTPHSSLWGVWPSSLLTVLVTPTLCEGVTFPSLLSIPATAPASLHSTELFLSLLWLDPDLVLRRLVWVPCAQLAAGGTFTGEKTTFGREWNVYCLPRQVVLVYTLFYRNCAGTSKWQPSY